MRTFAYIRVSKERDDMISPEIQRDEITRFCRQKGWEVAEWFQDLDLSGRLGPEDRPALQELIRRAQDRDCDAVVFYRIDRLSREPAHHYAILASLREAGVHVDSVGLPADDTPEGAFMWDLSAALAKLESLRLGKRLRDMHRRLATEGRWGGGVVPYGWRHVHDENGARLVLDPEEAHWRRWIHEQYQAGWSCFRITRHLNDHGVRTRRGVPWHDGVVWNMLRSPYQVGARQTEEGLSAGGNVEPLLTQESYERTLALMQIRHRVRGRLGSHEIPARICRCGNCGGAMVSGSTKKLGERHISTYHCQRHKIGVCEHGVSIRYHKLLPFVEKRLFQHLKGSRAPRPKREDENLAPLIEELERVRDSLGRLALMRAEGQIGEAEFQSARALQRKRQDKLEAKLDRMSHRLEGDVRQSLLDAAWEDLGQLTQETWQVLSLQAKRDIIGLVIDQIVIEPATGHDYADYTHIPADKRVRIRWR